MMAGKRDYLLWGSLLTVTTLYLLEFILADNSPSSLLAATGTAREMVHATWWAIALGIAFVGILGRIPRHLVLALLGKGGTARGIVRAAAAGVLLDLCSHGILMVGMKLYERGASLGQTMAFLIASPWNSFSLTLILVGLIGFGWTMAFIALSFLIAILTGYLFDRLVRRQVLPDNPNTPTRYESINLRAEAILHWKNIEWSWLLVKDVLVEGLRGSRMVLRWIFFGICLAAVIRALMPMEQFQDLFGPTLAGLGLTLLAATVIEVCSEGSTPLAADLLNRGNAPGNSFTFLMAGVSTDYTEIMSIRDTMASWKIALCLPLFTLPQIITVGFLLNIA